MSAAMYIIYMVYSSHPTHPSFANTDTKLTNILTNLTTNNIQTPISRAKIRINSGQLITLLIVDYFC